MDFFDRGSSNVRSKVKPKAKPKPKAVKRPAYGLVNPVLRSRKRRRKQRYHRTINKLLRLILRLGFDPLVLMFTLGILGHELDIKFLLRFGFVECLMVILAVQVIWPDRWLLEKNTIQGK